MNETHIPPPVESVPDGQGISIHLSYLRRDMDEVKVTTQRFHTDILSKLQEMQAQYPTREEFKELIDSKNDHEGRLRTIEKTVWKWIGISSAVGAVISIVIQLFYNK